MKYTDETVKKFLDFIEKEKTLKEVCLEMDMNEYKVLDLVSYIRSKGINIAMQNTADENIYMVNMGDYEFVEKNVYNFQTNENNEFKFIVIADTRLGSK